LDGWGSIRGEVLAVHLFLLLAPAVSVAGTAFTYQGELTENGVPANGTFDIAFSLWDAPDGGNEICCPVVVNDVQVVDGRFNAQLDFGADAFDNQGRWLELIVEGFTLSPRQPITRSPYAIQTRGIFVDENHNVGIGTTTPEERVHIVGNDATLRIETDGPTNDGTFLRDTADGVSRLWKQVSIGDAHLDIDAIPTTGFSNAAVRFFRHTSTSGGKQVEFYEGNGTDQISARIGTFGADSWFQLLSGDFGIGTDDPQARLDVIARGNGKAGRFLGDVAMTGGLEVAGDGSVPVIRAEIDGTGAGLRVADGPDTLDVDVNSINTRGDSPIGDPLYLNDEVSESVLIGFGGGNCGIGGGTAGLPQTRLHVDGGSDVTVSDLGSGYLLLGSPADTNIVMDNNEIMARNNGQPSTLHLNAEGGDVKMGPQQAHPAYAYASIVALPSLVFVSSGTPNVVDAFQVTNGTFDVLIDGGVAPDDVIIVTSNRADIVATGEYDESGGTTAVRCRCYEVDSGDPRYCTFSLLIFRP